MVDSYCDCDMCSVCVWLYFDLLVCCMVFVIDGLSGWKVYLVWVDVMLVGDVFVLCV